MYVYTKQKACRMSAPTMDITLPGCVQALKISGRESNWMRTAEDTVLRPSSQLNKIPHLKRFSRLDTHIDSSRPQPRPSCRLHRIRLHRQCHAINGLVLVITNLEQQSLNKLIASISVEIGGQLFDEFGRRERRIDEDQDIETQIASVASLYSKRIHHIDGKTFVPLCLAPFHDCNLLWLATLTCHDCVLYLEMLDDVEFHICGNCYFIDETWFNSVKPRKEMQCQITYQNVNFKEVCTSGTNTFRLHFMHALRCLLIWGPPKSKMTRVKLSIEGLTYLDSSVAELEYDSVCRSLEGPSNVVFIHLSSAELFSNDQTVFDSYPINKFELTVDYEEIRDTPLYICGVNTQIFANHHGMCGLMFSK